MTINERLLPEHDQEIASARRPGRTVGRAAAARRYYLSRKTQDGDHAAEERERLRQHHTGETPRQAGFEGGQIRPVHFAQSDLYAINSETSGWFSAVAGRFTRWAS